MKEKIAVLGPEGTFTDLAARKYMGAIDFDGERVYCTSMRKTFEAVTMGACRYGVIPIENTLDGFVQIILDLLAQTGLKIIHELVIPIRFAFVSNCEAIEDVEEVYVQFKSHNQCSNFLEQFSEDHIVTTASNSYSYQHVVDGGPKTGAIIPMHMLSYGKSFAHEIEDVADSIDNHTRFIVISKYLNEEVDITQKWKTSFVVGGENDRPGLLADIIGHLGQSDVNMISIMSRPTKVGLGNYNFFIDIDGCYQKDVQVREAIAHVLEKYDIQILGSYYRIQTDQ